MINDKDTQEGLAPMMDDEREEDRRASQHFSRSLFRAGVGLALLPISVLPPEPQQHFKVAGREFAHGLAKLVHQLAERLDEFLVPARGTITLHEHTDRDTDVSQV